MAETLVLRGTMKGHADMVTAIATPIDNSDMIVSSSRDKSVLVWHLTKEEGTYGVPRRRLTGHSHFVQDVVFSSDGQFALSGSWDGELRLWDINTGVITRRFVSHSKDVLSVDPKQIQEEHQELFFIRSQLSNKSSVSPQEQSLISSVSSAFESWPAHSLSSQTISRSVTSVAKLELRLRSTVLCARIRYFYA